MARSPEQPAIGFTRIPIGKDERLVVDAANQAGGPGLEKILRRPLTRKIPEGGRFRGNRPAPVASPREVRIPGFQPDQGVFTEFGLNPGQRLRSPFRTGGKRFPGGLVQAGLFRGVDATESPENEAEDPSPRFLFRGSGGPLKHSPPGGGAVLRRAGPEPQAEQGEEFHAVFGGEGGADRTGNWRSVFAFHFVGEFDDREALFPEIGEDLIEQTLRVEDEPLDVGLGRFEGDPVLYRRLLAEGF